MTSERHLQIDGAYLISTLLADHVHLVRVFPDRVTAYRGITTVTEQDEGRRLYLQGLLTIDGPPTLLTPRQWRQGRDGLFPLAVLATWYRRNLRTGEERLVSLPLPPHQDPA